MMKENLPLKRNLLINLETKYIVLVLCHQYTNFEKHWVQTEENISKHNVMAAQTV
jgi:hypothetical protein